jgi:hypothetical protein
MTRDFSLDPNGLHLIRDGSTISYARITSVEIFEGIRISKRKFTIAFWVIWLGVLFLILRSQGKIGFEKFEIADMTTLLLAGLGLLAINPIYNMFPSGTFLRIWYEEKFIDLEISELTKDDRIHTLIGKLKAVLGKEKIKIKKNE